MKVKRQTCCILLAGVCAAGGAWAVSCDGTNVWIGAASGGSWSNAANWEAAGPADRERALLIARLGDC